MWNSAAPASAAPAIARNAARGTARTGAAATAADALGEMTFSKNGFRADGCARKCASKSLYAPPSRTISKLT